MGNSNHAGFRRPPTAGATRAVDVTADATTTGFTLVEVMMAIVILLFGLVSLAQSSILMVNQVNVSDVRTERVVARYAAVEQLRAIPFNNVTGGTTTVGDFTMNWRVAGTTTNSRLIEMVTTGPGTQAGAGLHVTTGVVDTVTFRIVRP